MYSLELFLENASMIGRYDEHNSRWYRKDDKVQAAIDAALCFTTRAEYLQWVADWKIHYRMMAVDARSDNPQYQRYQRRGMMRLRMEGKRRSWARKHAPKVTVEDPPAGFSVPAYTPPPPSLWGTVKKLFS